MVFLVYFFFFKQKTAYEMRMSDWSSDVCSSDLRVDLLLRGLRLLPRRGDGAFRLAQLQLVVEAGVDALAAQFIQARGARLFALRDVEQLVRLRKRDVAARDVGRQRQPRGLRVDRKSVV